MKSIINTHRYKKVLVILEVLILASCVKNDSYKAPENSCTNDIIANTSLRDVQNLYIDQVIQITEDKVIEGVVISSDKAGNFYSVLHIQDKALGPTAGFQIEIDVRDAYLSYPLGSKVFVKLKGLYLGKTRSTYKIGSAFNTFGNLAVGRLPALTVSEHLFKSCEEKVEVQPTYYTVTELESGVANTLIKLQDVEFVEEELGNPYAIPQEETKRVLKDCDGNLFTLVNSGYANFQDVQLPQGNGDITAVLLKDATEPYLVIRDTIDIQFNQERCPPDMVTSSQVFISELADPNNNTGARFVELFNASENSISLKGWTLNRYTNANTEISSSIDLTDHIIEGNSTLVISPNAIEFENVYGFSPDVAVSTGGPADSNGDDNLVLIDPFGTVIDVFGVIGEDGSNTHHEFEDGRAVRKNSIYKASSTFAFEEWEIYNDTGASGTINQPQNAPEDFNPGIR